MQIKGYQNGGFTPEEPVPTGVHNNIDNLILQAELENIGSVKESSLGKLFDKAKGLNIPNILGKIKRTNPEWTGEAGKRAGELGVSIRGYPEWMQKGLEKISGRGGQLDFVIGNTIFMGGGEKPYNELRKALEKPARKDRKYYPGTSIPFPSKYREHSPKEIEESIQGSIRSTIEEELPHVQQFREEGLLGFLGKHVKDLLKHGAGEKTYSKKGTHEYGAHRDIEERQRLLSPFMNEGGTVGESQEISKYSTSVPRPQDNNLLRALLGFIEARPELIEGKLEFPYQRIDIPLGKKTRFTGERGRGLYPLSYNPTGKKDLRFTLSRNF